MLGGSYWKRTGNEDRNKRSLRVGCVRQPIGG